MSYEMLFDSEGVSQILVLSEIPRWEHSLDEFIYNRRKRGDFKTHQVLCFVE